VFTSRTQKRPISAELTGRYGVDEMYEE